jgi:hypothetical protein
MLSSPQSHTTFLSPPMKVATPLQTALAHLPFHAAPPRQLIQHIFLYLFFTSLHSTLDTPLKYLLRDPPPTGRCLIRMPLMSQCFMVTDSHTCWVWAGLWWGVHRDTGLAPDDKSLKKGKSSLTGMEAKFSQFQFKLPFPFLWPISCKSVC